MRMDWRGLFCRPQRQRHPPRSSATSPSPPPANTNNVTKTAVNGLIIALKLLKEAVTGVGVPGLEATVSGVVAVIDLIQDVKDNAEALGDLDSRISALAHAMSSSPDLHRGAEVDGPLRSRVDGFLLELHRMLMKVQQMLQDKNFVAKTANSKAHKDAIGDINTKIDRLQSRFTTEGILSVELGVSSALREIQMLAQSQKAQEYEDRINAIPRAHARYNDTSTKPSRPCHPGTRIDLLQSIRRWIYGGRGTTPYFWLCGEVGVGKTSVAHTIAQENEALQQLGACFFFSRHDESRRTPHLLFTSIAYQLARFHPGFYKVLAEILRPDPDIVKRTPMEQFKQLVLEPLIQSGIESSQTVVIVIDGLDECSDPASILDVFANGIDNVGVRLRVLISSRPYSTILTKFKEAQLYHLTSETQFHDINPATLSNDVAAYLTWSLEALAAKSNIPSPWPPKAHLDELIKRAAGLMIVASTYIKYIDDPDVGNPKGQLARIISRKRGMGSSPLAELDALYDQILGDLRSKLVSDSEMANALDIIAFVILSPKGINASAIAGLLCVDTFDVRLVLRRLTAVILLPEDDSGNIAPFHASFGEYICDPTRCTVRELAIGAEAACGRIVARCSDAIMSATNNGIIGVEYNSASGDAWTPAYLDHVACHLPHYLSRSPTGVKQATRNVIGAAIWPLLHLRMFTESDRDFSGLINALGGSEDLRGVDGSSEEEMINVMISHLTSEINRMCEKAQTAHGVEASGLEQCSMLRFTFSNRRFSPAASGGLHILRNVRCWMKYTHKNVMSCKGVDVKSDDENGSQEVLVFVESPNNFHHSSNLYEHLKGNHDVDKASRVRMALDVADGLYYLHGSFPPQPHNNVNPHQIIVCGKGQPVLCPPTWTLDFQHRAARNEKDDVDEISGYWDYKLGPSGSKWYHWNPTKGDDWKKSLEARLQVDVWDFGSILYQLIAGEEPLTTYNRLAEADEASGYKLPTHQHYDGTWINDTWDISRYEAAVPLLLNALETSEDITALVKSCWTIQPQDRPPMSDVFKRLKAIVETTEM